LNFLILSASIGEGHDLPARMLRDGILEERPDAEVEIVDSLSLVNPLARRLVLDGSRFHSPWGNRFFDLSYRLISDVRATRWLAGKLTLLLGARPIERAVRQRRPDVVVSTYPGTSEVLGALRQRGRVDVPVVSAITDLAALRYWAHPGVDLHLLTHPESEEEVRAIAPESWILPARGMTDPRFYQRRGRTESRRALGLALEGPLVLVSGGGWAVGDLEGAAEEALRLEGSTVVCLCGRNEELHEALSARFASESRLLVEEFTERMPEWFGAADLLVHSTAGLTVLEAIMSGCGVVSYGWGLGHVRVNNEAFLRFGLAEVAESRADLGPAMRRALAAKPAPDDAFAALPSAASAIVRLADGEPGDRGRARQESGAHRYGHQSGGENPTAEGRVRPALAADQRSEHDRDHDLHHQHRRGDSGSREPL
jgi:processive 1,2-diacylglycerol beta-glucosyltransferase